MLYYVPLNVFRVIKASTSMFQVETEEAAAGGMLGPSPDPTSTFTILAARLRQHHKRVPENISEKT